MRTYTYFCPFFREQSPLFWLRFLFSRFVNPAVCWFCRVFAFFSRPSFVVFLSINPFPSFRTFFGLLFFDFCSGPRPKRVRLGKKNRRTGQITCEEAKNVFISAGSSERVRKRNETYSARRKDLWRELFRQNGGGHFFLPATTTKETVGFSFRPRVFSLPTRLRISGSLFF